MSAFAPLKLTHVDPTIIRCNTPQQNGLPTSP